MKMKNYISVTAGKDIDEAAWVLREFDKAGIAMNSQYLPALGILVSRKTMEGKSTRNLRFPDINDITSIAETIQGRALMVVHYNTKDLDTLSTQVKILMSDLHSQDLCSTLQLNTDWPGIAEVAMIKNIFPSLKIILQISEKAMKVMSMAERNIAERIHQYKDSIDCALIDPSKGRGREFQIEHSANVFKEIKNLDTNLGVTFAGGLSGENVIPVLSELIDLIESRDFSIDAEGRLRDQCAGENFFGNDMLNPEKLRMFLEKANEILNKPKHD